MSLSSNTLCLDVATWDLILDASGSIAMASPPYALAQDVASAIKTFLGECYYDTTIGIPYLSQILGQRPPVALLKQYIVDAALTVPGVVSATCIITGFVGRQAQGQVQFTDDEGQTGTVGLGAPSSSPPASWTADSSVVTADSGIGV
jgi:hypothetical protein